VEEGGRGAPRARRARGRGRHPSAGLPPAPRLPRPRPTPPRLPLSTINESDVVEFELRSKRFSLAVRKKEALVSAAPEPTVVYAAPPQGAPMYAPAPLAAAPAAAAPVAAPAAPAAPPPPAAVDGVEQASPMAGTFYRSPAPGEPAFSKEGDVVVKGQTICIIEAMKLMNEIEAESSGTLVKFCVDNATPVTPGQVCGGWGWGWGGRRRARSMRRLPTTPHTPSLHTAARHHQAVIGGVRRGRGRARPSAPTRARARAATAAARERARERPRPRRGVGGRTGRRM